MVAYVTFLLLILVLVFPVSFIVALIIKLFQIPKMMKEMYPGAEAIMKICEEQNKNGDIKNDD